MSQIPDSNMTNSKDQVIYEKNSHHHKQNKVNVQPSSSITLNSEEEEQQHETADNDQSINRGKTSYMAWAQVIVYLSICCCSEYSWTTASSIPVAASNWMGISLTQLNWISNMTAIFDTIFSLFAAWCYDQYGIKNSIMLAATINALGCWIKCIAILLPVNKRYVVVMIGQSVASAGGPLIFNLTTKFVSIWFAAKDRGIAVNLLSISIGKITGPILLPTLAPTDKGVPKMLVILASISTICTIPTFLLPKRPRVPPSATSNIPRVPFWQGVKQISKNTQFWWTAMVSSVSLGLHLSISALMIEIVIPHGYTEKQGGIAVSLKEIGGFVGGAVSGYWLGKTGQHLMLLKIFVPISVFACTALIFQIIPNSFATIAIGCIMYGFFARGSTPIYLELASELTYPVSESIATSIIWTLSTINMLIFIVILDTLRAKSDGNPPGNMKFSLIAAAAISAVGCLPCLWIKGDLKRLEVDNEKEHTGNQSTV